MKTNFTRWLPSVAKTPTLRSGEWFARRGPIGKTALAAAGFTAVCGGIAGPAVAASGAPVTADYTTAAVVKPAPHTKADNGKHAKADNGKSGMGKDNGKPGANTKPKTPPAPPLPVAKQLNYQYQLQSTFFYCGPAATRIAVSVQGHSPGQDELASKLGTTINGTNSAVDTTRVLNAVDGNKSYHTTSIPGKNATPAQAAKFQSDVVQAINAGNPIVANIAGTATDTLGGMHSYDGGHYVTVVGYQDNGKTVLVADPADTVADGSYWVHTTDFANWMGTRGYSS